MEIKEQIIKIVFDSITEINIQNNINIAKELETKLFGKDGDLDSLSLVSLIVNIEDAINEKFDVAISIADEKAMSQKRSPFLSVKTLVNYIEILLREESEK